MPSVFSLFSSANASQYCRQSLSRFARAAYDGDIMRLVKPLSSRGPPDGRSVTRREERRAVRVFPAAEESKGISGEM